MPLLENVHHEAFARARAKGARLDDAYEDAGFTPGRGHASRLAKRPDVAARIAELKLLEAGVERASSPVIIAALLQLALDKEISPAAAREARLMLVEASRLHAEMVKARALDRALNPN
jgi:hypothetical protein